MILALLLPFVAPLVIYQSCLKVSQNQRKQSKTRRKDKKNSLYKPDKQNDRRSKSQSNYRSEPGSLSNSLPLSYKSTAGEDRMASKDVGAQHKTPNKIQNDAKSDDAKITGTKNVRDSRESLNPPEFITSRVNTSDIRLNEKKAPEKLINHSPNKEKSAVKPVANTGNQSTSKTNVSHAKSCQPSVQRTSGSRKTPPGSNSNGIGIESARAIVESSSRKTNKNRGAALVEPGYDLTLQKMQKQLANYAEKSQGKNHNQSLVKRLRSTLLRKDSPSDDTLYEVPLDLNEESISPEPSSQLRENNPTNDD